MVTIGAVTAILLALLVTGPSLTESYRILAVFPFNGKSHDVVLDAIAQGLAKRGHQVDVVTHFPPKNPPDNYKVLVDLRGTIEETINNFTLDFARSLSGQLTDYIAGKFGNELCELLALDGIQKIVKNPPKDPPYDLVVVHAYGANCFFGIGHVLKVPVVAVSASIEFPWMSYFIGNDDNLAYAANIYTNKYDANNFWDRMKNMYKHYNNLYKFHSLTDEPQTTAMRKYLDPNMPSIRDIERSIALTIINRHPAIHGPKPVVSSMIEVSGLHIEDNPELPTDLKKWLDEAEDGVVYFSFGSMVLIETLPTDVLLGIYEAISRLDHLKFLIKVADDKKLPPGLPDNVLTRPWIPQQAVLSHKNVRLFLTHTGLMSSQESIHYGVPIIGVPLFCDQWRNIRVLVERGMAIQLNYNNLTADSVYWAIEEILTNGDYKSNAVRLSKLFKDVPMKPINKAIFWIEYVIRNGPLVLRSPALDLHWWQLAHLDMVGVALLVIIFSLVAAYYLTKLQLMIFSHKPSKKEKPKTVKPREKKVKKVR
ncbi:2-hydroxyacylsphingosine 1-beta-galactosyltransferase [Copidosoma floridanum]|uniref:2-hydroxyacylsphingosine 1-beta-galactosyltransferase n=1 Tax=Copidosoma floridanum TaxID=29053 RepID=UPI0006C9D39E|nr:2-hydroxyacylsphingosine 1-beta-galactosyltransferase [Copidosoma floridanum]XP_014204619.1 2-hydroxyacylsphingosine 1-beta-galactosyltransferase [Copidosoma floridanum]XP_023245424.1 2-hydroxyacylsphingosine 1-beta-galactosyltransferase [Copidosoma floridanum]